MSQKLKNNRFNLWEYLYYRSTVFYSKTEKKSGYADNKNSGAFIVAICVGLNALTIMSWLLVISVNNFSSKLPNDVLMKCCFITVLIFIQFVSWFYLTKKHHKTIFSKYELESETQKKKRGWIIAVYCVLSIIFILITVDVCKGLL